MVTNERTKNKSKINYTSAEKKLAESGFSLIEVIIALVIFLVSILGIFAAFTYAVKYNSGNSKRSQALSVLQQEVELLRSAKFTPTIYNDSSLTGGTKTPKTVTASDGFSYRVETIVDNDPVTLGVQSTNNSTTTLKEITVTVIPQSVNGSWETAFPTRVVMRRVRGN
jgi:prepilin-type N-terminal cleavage/methylation domain-containing protein